jgi:hypothetical protein
MAFFGFARLSPANLADFWRECALARNHRRAGGERKPKDCKENWD